MSKQERQSVKNKSAEVLKQNCRNLREDVISPRSGTSNTIMGHQTRDLASKGGGGECMGVGKTFKADKKP